MMWEDWLYKHYDYLNWQSWPDGGGCVTHAWDFECEKDKDNCIAPGGNNGTY